MQPDPTAAPTSSDGTATSGSYGPPDALSQLKQDHEEVEMLFSQCEQPQPASGASDPRADLIRHICRELTVHAQLEEQVFYPALREAGVDSRLLDEAVQEHAEAKQLIAQLERNASGDAVIEPLQRLMAAVRQHVQEEESQLFPAAREHNIDLSALGRRLSECKPQVKQQAREQQMQGQPRSAAQSQMQN